MDFYVEHFKELRDKVSIHAPYMRHHWMHALCISLCQFKVSSHRLWVKLKHQLNRLDRIFQLCHLWEVETKVHFIFHCALYYEIKGQQHCLLRELQTLSSFFKYPNQRWLALFIQEALRLCSHTICPPPRLVSTQIFTSSCMVLQSTRSIKKQTNSDTGYDPRLVQTHETIPTS